MPVSFQALSLSILFALALLSGATLRWKRRGSAYLRWGVLSIGAVGLLGPIVGYYGVCSYLKAKAQHGTAFDRFNYARWLESAPDLMACVTIFPFSFRFEESWHWLEIAAQDRFPEAMFAVGVRLKYDFFVPQTSVLPKSDGQQFIDDAIEGGYECPVAEQEYYFRLFRIHGRCLF